MRAKYIKESIDFKRGISSKESLNLGIRGKLYRFIENHNENISQAVYNENSFIKPGNYVELVRALINQTTSDNLIFLNFLFDELEPAALDMIFAVSLYSFSKFGVYWQDTDLVNEWINLGRKALNDPRLNVESAEKNLRVFMQNYSRPNNNNIEAWAKEIINHPKIKPLIKRKRYKEYFKI